LLLQEGGVTFSYTCHSGVVGSKRLFLNYKGTLQERLSLFVLSLLPVELSQVIETVSGIRVIKSKSLSMNGESTLVECFGLLIAPLRDVNSC